MSTRNPNANTGDTGDTEFSVSLSQNADLPRTVWRQLADAKQGQATERQNIKANAALPPDSWEARDDAVYTTMEQSLVLVNALRQAGLTYSSITLDAKYDTWGLIDDRGSADVRMDPETEHRESAVTFGEDGAPVPVVQDGYSIGFRDNPYQDARMPESLDETQDQVITRHISETVEEMFVNGSQFDLTVGTANGNQGYTLYGMTDHPATAKNTMDSDWTTSQASVYDDIVRMRSVLKNDRQYSTSGVGYWLGLGSEYMDVLDQPDSTFDNSQTLRQRVDGMSSISRVMEIDYLDPKSALMFRPTRDVIEVGIAADLTPVQWEDAYRSHRDIIASLYPRIKQTPDGVTGIAYFTAP